MPTFVGNIGKASVRLAVHVASRKQAAGVALSAPRVLSLSAVASCLVAKHAINRSEAAQRCLYFWKVAGPIVFHYKWTRFWLKATKAPVEHRDIVYKSLHDRYATPSLELALRLKGKPVTLGQKYVLFCHSQFCSFAILDRSLRQNRTSDVE